MLTKFEDQTEGLPIKTVAYPFRTTYLCSYYWKHLRR